MHSSAAGPGPAAQVVLIGAADVPVATLAAEPNIHLLGPKPFSALPAYVRHFSVGVIPFVVNELTRAVNPIKLREMMAAGCPVVSTALPEVERYAGDDVAIGHDRDEFVAHVSRFLRDPVAATVVGKPAGRCGRDLVGEGG